MPVDTNNLDGETGGPDAGVDAATCTTTGGGGGGEDEKVAAFLARCGLKPSTVAAAHDFAGTKFPGCEVAPAPFQGYCSYTLLLLPPTPGGRRRDSGVEAGDGSSNGGGGGGSGKGFPAGVEKGSNLLVQFRPGRHGIDVGVCAEARGVFGSGIVPGVEDLGALTGLETVGAGRGDDGELRAYALERVGGVSLTEFRGLSAALGMDPRACRRRVVADLAIVFADSWRGRRERRDVAKGKVGGSLRWRVEVLAKGLPKDLRGVARGAMEELEEVEGLLPWVVTHGDLVPDNILVHPPCEDVDDGARGWNGRRQREMRERAGGLVGLIDWAEAEWLPFGVGMYGLEEVLGEDVPVEDDGPKSGGSNATSASGGPAATRFEYYPEANALRNLFWDEVGRVVGDDDVIRRARLAQVLGVLLWRGIAFDDGALGRVVDERDWWDLQRLRVWLFGDGGLGLAGSKEEEREVQGRRRRWLSKVWRLVRRCFKAF
ncbi:uncharacterized protein ColSpa_04088 [Colletotrichum spaethianum]|uniref:Aminoglycoside phosphotransferase domain-containing protein n=1 Tax=Colletotrichum spaethianum TaxID=700344 RepID=A0AA37L8R3_9PEZI|nr:uncharacterized protein ColSpa_04088 [Colletotrichum spaethianum]GKT43907.1 hypothetical protein ColSpa_04088 [Colletotrichum spaethianum]